MKRPVLSEKATTGLITTSVILLFWLVQFVAEIAITGRPPDFSFLRTPGFWAGIIPLICWCAVSGYEFRRRKAYALPYLLLYMMAAIFYSVFITLSLSDPRFRGNFNIGILWYLVLTTLVFLIGTVLHWRAVRYPRP